MFTDFKREYLIFRTLRLLSKQKVAIVLQPGNIWVIEKAMPDTEQNNENIQTCLMRGWVEVLHESVPTEKLDTNSGKIPNLTQENIKNIYKLTDSGWNAIHRTHTTTLLSIIIAILGVILTLTS